MLLFPPSADRRAYLIRLIPYFFASAILFALGAFAGLVIIQQIPEIADRLIDHLAKFVQQFAGMPSWKLATAIFLNNAVKTLIAIVLGVFLGIVPVIFLLANGAALAVAFSVSVQSRGLWLSLASIAPHGIIELPAALLGTSIGLMLGVRAIQHLFGHHSSSIGQELALGFRFFCAVIIPLLLLAALVEAFVTTALVTPR